MILLDSDVLIWHTRRHELAKARLAQIHPWQMLEGRFAVEEMAIGVPKQRAQGAAYLRQFVEDARKQGLVKRTLDSGRLPGVVEPAF